MSEADDRIDGLVAAGDVEALKALAAGKDKALAKAARRGLHLLRARGVEVGEAPRPAGEARPQPAPLSGEKPEAFAGVPDRRGLCLVTLALPSASGGYDFVHATVSDETGLDDVVVGRGPKRVFRDARKQFEASGMALAEVPLEYTAALLERGYRRTLEAGRSPPDGFPAARRLLAEIKPASDEEIGRALEGIPALAGAAATELGERLHALPDVRGWTLGREALEALALRMEEIATSSLMVDDAQRDRARRDAVDKAIEQAFDPAGRERWRRRLEAAALIYAAAGQLEAAQMCVTQAHRLLDHGFEPLADGFCRLFVEKLLPAAQRSAPRGGLIVER